MMLVMVSYLPNRQTNVKRNFAYSALADFAQSANDAEMTEESIELEPENNIKLIREGLGMSLEELSEQSGISLSYLSRIENRKRTLSLATMHKVAGPLRVQPPALITTTHVPHRIIISGRVQAGKFVYEDDVAQDVEDFVDIPVEPELRRFRLYALRVVGNSMNLVYPDGSLIVCAHLEETLEAPIPGKRYVVRRIRPDGAYEQTVKEYVVDSSGRKWLMPRSTEPEWQQPIPYQDGTEGETVDLQARVLFSMKPE